MTVNPAGSTEWCGMEWNAFKVGDDLHCNVKEIEIDSGERNDSDLLDRRNRITDIISRKVMQSL